MRDTKAILTATWTLLAILWPVSAFAASQGLGEALTLKTIASALLLSVVSGLTSLLYKMQKDLKDHGHIQHLWLYVTSKMMGSVLAGLVALFWTEGDYDANKQAMFILAASFGGIVFLEQMLAKFNPKKEA